MAGIAAAAENGEAAPPPAPAPDTSAGAVPAPTGVAKGSLNPGKRGLALPSSANVMIIPVHDANTRYGMIDDWQAIYIERRLRRAQDEKMDLVVLEIDTYGGSVAACERINKAIAASSVPVVAFVKLKAFSGGAIISLGCKAIVMTPGSRIGGAKAVTLFGEIPPDMRQKVDSDMRAMVKNLCSTNNYPAAIAIGMVNSEVEVVETGDPKDRFLTGDDYDDLAAKPAKLRTWKKKGEILTLTASEAVSVGLASGLAADSDELYLGLGVTPGTIEVADITASERVARFLGHPAWRVLLVIIGLVGLIWELKSPGHGLGYMVFAFCLGIFFWLQIFSDNAGLVEVALFGIGAALVAVEIFFLPSFGAMGFVGFAMVLASIILAFLPESVSVWKLFKGGTPADVALLNEGLKWAAVTVMAIVAAAIAGLKYGANLPGLSRMALQTVSGDVVVAGGGISAPPVQSALAALVGQTADAETVLRPAGKIRLGGATYDAVSEGAFIEAGSKVAVLRISSGTLVVRAV